MGAALPSSEEGSTWAEFVERTFGVSSLFLMFLINFFERFSVKLIFIKLLIIF